MSKAQEDGKLAQIISGLDDSFWNNPKYLTPNMKLFYQKRAEEVKKYLSQRQSN